uniref:Glyoxalase/bleomycin resistance protein/dioxygenase n=1 Tax=Rhizobium meliloti TaxID=382 RepID=I2E242_RHIML|nr:glyoxalase/bleomycin resistance protein/dioxygenase [Sinorhizobium meliloti]
MAGGQPNGKWNRAGNLNEWNSEAGRFARIHDPEGNPVEPWEPAQD